MIVQPNFSQKEIREFFEKDIILSPQNGFFKIKNNYNIFYFIDFVGYNIFIYFYNKSYKFAEIMYSCHRVVKSNTLCIHNAEYYVRKDARNTFEGDYILQDEFREYLINIPELSEWSIWNQV